MMCTDLTSLYKKWPVVACPKFFHVRRLSSDLWPVVVLMMCSGILAWKYVVAPVARREWFVHGEIPASSHIFFTMVPSLLWPIATGWYYRMCVCVCVCVLVWLPYYPQTENSSKAVFKTAFHRHKTFCRGEMVELSIRAKQHARIAA